MAAEKIEEHEKSAKNIIWQLFLIVAPWLIFWTVKEFWSHLGILLFGPMKAPVFGALVPFELFLVVGIVIAWRRNFPLWS